MVYIFCRISGGRSRNRKGWRDMAEAYLCNYDNMRISFLSCFELGDAKRTKTRLRRNGRLRGEAAGILNFVSHSAVPGKHTTTDSFHRRLTMRPQLPGRAIALRQVLLNAPVKFEHQLMYVCKLSPSVPELISLQPQIHLHTAPRTTTTRLQLPQELLTIFALAQEKRQGGTCTGARQCSNEGRRGGGPVRFLRHGS